MPFAKRPAGTWLQHPALAQSGRATQLPRRRLDQPPQSRAMAARLILAKAPDAQRRLQRQHGEQFHRLPALRPAEDFPLIPREKPLSRFLFRRARAGAPRVSSSWLGASIGNHTSKYPSLLHRSRATPRGGRRVAPIRKPSPGSRGEPIRKVRSRSTRRYFFAVASKSFR